MQLKKNKYNITIKFKHDLSEQEVLQRIKEFQDTFVDMAAKYYATKNKEPK